MNCIKFILVLIKCLIISSNIIQTNNLTSALEQVSPGDTIELQSGEYSSVPYKLISGTENRRITIKPIDGAFVKFKGSNTKCIFELNEIAHITIEGPFELMDSLCGIKAMDVSDIEIKGIKIYNMQQYGLVLSGENNEISNNEIYDCVQENKSMVKKLTSGWKQCVTVMGKKYNSYYSKNITFKNNNIRNSFGEGLYFQKCDGCSSILNNITNCFSYNIYCYSSKNILIDRNIIRVNSDEYSSQVGNACGIGLSSENSKYDIIDNILIKNNIIIGARIAINFFQTGSSGYNNIKILYNTIWQISVTSLWFEKPSNIPTNCELRNNIIYIYGWIADFYPKKSWTIGTNFYYNYPKIPVEYLDTDQKSLAVKNIDINSVFNNRKNNCNYDDKNIDINCLRPSTSPNISFNLFHGGSNPSINIYKDFSGCNRSTNYPTIGAFEYYIRCTEYYEIDDLIIKFRIHYCTQVDQTVRLNGDFNNWDTNKTPIFTYEENCFWSYLFYSIDESFEYKFVIFNGDKLSRWEQGENRNFNLNDLANAIKTSSKGIYENCNYDKEDNILTYQCNWK